jgi:hypothetical protein
MPRGRKDLARNHKWISVAIWKRLQNIFLSADPRKAVNMLEEEEEEEEEEEDRKQKYRKT